jgi:hypothetical protein
MLRGIRAHGVVRARQRMRVAHRRSVGGRILGARHHGKVGRAIEAGQLYRSAVEGGPAHRAILRTDHEAASVLMERLLGGGDKLPTGK